MAQKDTLISLSTSNDEIITIFQNEIIINEGEYYAVGEFQVNKPGEVSLYAENLDTDPGSSKISVIGYSDNEDNSERDDESRENHKIQLYVIPEKISNFATSSTFAIVQLQGPDGTPIKAYPGAANAILADPESIACNLIDVIAVSTLVVNSKICTMFWSDEVTIRFSIASGKGMFF